jgi:hypothetical protein
VCFYEVGTHYDGPRLSARNLARGVIQIGTGSSTEEFIDAINAAQKTFEASSRQIESGRIADLRPAGTDVSKSIDQLRKAPSLAAHSDKLVAALIRVLQDQYDLMQDIERSGTVTFAQSRRAKENSARYEAITSEFSSWVDAEGKKYGIQRDREH